MLNENQVYVIIAPDKVNAITPVTDGIGTVTASVLKAYHSKRNENPVQYRPFMG